MRVIVPWLGLLICVACSGSGLLTTNSQTNGMGTANDGGEAPLPACSNFDLSDASYEGFGAGRAFVSCTAAAPRPALRQRVDLHRFMPPQRVWRELRSRGTASGATGASACRGLGFTPAGIVFACCPCEWKDTSSYSDDVAMRRFTQIRPVRTAFARRGTELVIAASSCSLCVWRKSAGHKDGQRKPRRLFRRADNASGFIEWSRHCRIWGHPKRRLGDRDELGARRIGRSHGRERRLECRQSGQRPVLYRRLPVFLDTRDMSYRLPSHAPRGWELRMRICV
jgi:hypothetical protein